MAEAWWMGNGDDVQSAARVMSFYITQHEMLVKVPDKSDNQNLFSYEVIVWLFATQKGNTTPSLFHCKTSKCKHCSSRESIFES